MSSCVVSPIRILTQLHPFAPPKSASILMVLESHILHQTQQLDSEKMLFSDHKIILTQRRGLPRILPFFCEIAQNPRLFGKIWEKNLIKPRDSFLSKKKNLKTGKYHKKYIFTEKCILTEKFTICQRNYFFFRMTYLRFRQAGDFTARRCAHAGCPDWGNFNRCWIKWCHTSILWGAQ